MISKKAVEDFLSGKNIAVVGVSRSGNKSGNRIYDELTVKNYRTFAVNPKAADTGDIIFYKDLRSIPKVIDGVVLAVPPAVTDQVVREAHELGIKHIWMQLGSESQNAIDFCKEKGINVIHNLCIFMFAEPVESFHKVHKWFLKLFGRLPK
ncbi:CoA-binding protein [candidate division KSB1 bacterium]|nr:CoA-binding protein [candidate division KSB1 bacterium]